MGSLVGGTRRHHHFVIALIAVIGLEFDALCNRFALSVIIERVAPSWNASRQASATDSWDHDLSVWNGVCARVPAAPSDVEHAGQWEGPGAFGVMVEIAPAIAGRLSTRS